MEKVPALPTAPCHDMQIRFDDWDDRNLLMIVGKPLGWSRNRIKRLQAALTANTSLWLLQ